MTDTCLTVARTHWGFGTAPITLIAARENRVYRVECPDAPVALRMHRPGLRSPAELQSELDWMAMLAQGGVAVPAPVPALDGSLTCRCDATSLDVLSWVDGTAMSDIPPDLASYHTLGQLLAQMHDLADAWTLPAGFSRPQWDLIGPDPMWGRFWENPLISNSQRRRLCDFRTHAIDALAAMNSPDVGLIHADLVPENLLLSRHGLHPIDFDDGGFGPRLFDLATVTNRSRRMDPSGALAAACIAGYAENRALDIDALPLFEALRACTYLGWIIPRQSEEGAMARNARFITEAEARLNAL